MKNLTNLIANYWVLAIGTDCDGYAKGSVTPFAYQNDAVEYADGQNEWSDGIRYYITSSLDVLRDYCSDYNMDWMNYLNERTQ